MAVDGILGIKLGMTRVFADDGAAVPCTVLQAGPCVVVQRRSQQSEGYDAVQLGLVEFVKPQRISKAMTGRSRLSSSISWIDLEPKSSRIISRVCVITGRSGQRNGSGHPHRSAHLSKAHGNGAISPSSSSTTCNMVNSEARFRSV